MTLEEALKILDNIYMRGYKLKTKDDYAAIKLGIEAMKRIDEDRHQVVPLFLIKLPGETRDE